MFYFSIFYSYRKPLNRAIHVQPSFLSSLCTYQQYFCTSMLDKDKGDLGEEIQHIMQSLSISGYRDWAINSELIRKEQWNSRGIRGDTSRNVTIPYFGPEAEQVRKLYCRKGTEVHLKLTHSLRSLWPQRIPHQTKISLA